MFKKILHMVAIFFLATPNAFGKLYKISGKSIELDDEFLASLNEEQVDYLEKAIQSGALKTKNKAQDDSDTFFEYINMNRIETSDCGGANSGHHTDPTIF